MQSKQQSQRAVVITALPVEYKAVRSHLIDLVEDTHSRGTVYERGVFSPSDKTWDVALVEIGAGNPTAALEAERAISYFNPDVVLFVGVAGGVKDVAIGDVVVATKVYGYESGKANATFEPRPDVGEPSYRLVQRAKAEAKKGDWHSRIKGSSPQRLPVALAAPIAAGEKVVTATRSVVRQFLRRMYGDAVAVEMEGRGFMKAVHANQPLDALVIRGIADTLDDKATADAAGHQDLASRHASAFAFQLLATLPYRSRTDDAHEHVDSPADLSPTESARVHFADLIAYHCAVFAGRQTEIAAIRRAVSETDSNYIFIEGPSGFGKTALLAYLVKEFPDAAYHFMNQAVAGSSTQYDPNTEESFLVSMCIQLGMSLPRERHAVPHDIRGSYLALLSADTAQRAAKRIILIDAVDEVDPNHNFFMGLFPRSLPSNTCVIFSARTMGDRNYLRYIGLSSTNVKTVITLDRFDGDAIAALLRKAGGQAQQWADDATFVHRLLETTRGDPFYLRFLIDDIREGLVRRENIRDTPKGLYDYLDSQFEVLSRSVESRKQQRDILGYILTAKGPLSRSDLIARVDGLDAMNFEVVVRGIRRFLREYDSQFTFCHNRFKEYFALKVAAR